MSCIPVGCLYITDTVIGVAGPDEIKELEGDIAWGVRPDHPTIRLRLLGIEQGMHDPKSLIGGFPRLLFTLLLCLPLARVYINSLIPSLAIQHPYGAP